MKKLPLTTQRNNKKLSPVLSGVAGEYFVAAELSRLGYIATVTLRNTKGIDILVSNEKASKSIGLQVKTSQGAKRWLLNKKAEEYFADNLFYAFVVLKAKNSRPDYYIVPSKVVAEFIKVSHADWLRTPGKRGQAHQDTAMRAFEDKADIYLERWDALGL